MPESEIVARGWDLAGFQDHYEQVLSAVAGLDLRGPEETLLTHVRMLSEYQELPRTDPQLPEALLPDWIGQRVARRIEALRAQWAPVTRARFAEINAARSRDRDTRRHDAVAHRRRGAGVPLRCRPGVRRG